jgi:hypothetical protein
MRDEVGDWMKPRAVTRCRRQDLPISIAMRSGPADKRRSSL